MTPDNTLNERWFIFLEDKLVFVSQENGNCLPDQATITILQSKFIAQHTIGSFHDTLCHTAELDPGFVLDTAYESYPLRKAFQLLGEDWYQALAKAYSVLNWDKTHRFCGRCGAITEIKSKGFERICTNCSLALYPRISPSIVVRIQKGDEILMARSPHFAPGAYALIAGFVEIGESLEQTIHREVKEEVGIEIENIRYFASQSWPFPDSLMIGFTADYKSGELAIDGVEIEAAGWYRYDTIPGKPSYAISLSHQLIEDFITTQQRKLGITN